MKHCLVSHLLHFTFPKALLRVSVTLEEKHAQYAFDMHAYATLQSDIAKVAAKAAVARVSPS